MADVREVVGQQRGRMKSSRPWAQKLTSSLSKTTHIFNIKHLWTMKGLAFRKLGRTCKSTLAILITSLHLSLPLSLSPLPPNLLSLLSFYPFTLSRSSTFSPPKSSDLLNSSRKNFNDACKSKGSSEGMWKGHHFGKENQTSWIEWW